MPVPLIGIELSIPVTPNITNGISGFFCNYLKKDWRIEKHLQLTGVQIVRQYWQMNRLLPVRASDATQ